MTRIFTCDALCADISLDMKQPALRAALEPAIEEYNQGKPTKKRIRPGGKVEPGREDFQKLWSAIPPPLPSATCGGSSANVAVALRELLGEEVGVTFMGVPGTGVHGPLHRQGLRKAGVDLIDLSTPDSRGAVSLVIKNEKGERCIIKDIGSVSQLLTPDKLQDEMVQQSDIVLAQGGLWQKLGKDFPDRLLTLRWDNRKELWFTMPTDEDYAREHAGFFAWALTSANVVLANEKELSAVYNTTAGDALRQLQRGFNQNVLENENFPQRRPQVGFITCGGKGAFIVTKKNIEYIPPVKVKDEVNNTLGAGDTAFAGFLAGHLRNLSYKECARLGMALAAEKLKINAARLEKPLEVLLARTLLGAKGNNGFAHGFGDGQVDYPVFR